MIAAAMCALLSLACPEPPAASHSVGIAPFEAPARRWCIAMRDSRSGEIARILDTEDADSFVLNWTMLTNNGVAHDEMILRCVLVTRARAEQ